MAERDQPASRFPFACVLRAVAAACATVLATGAFAAPPAGPAVPDLEPIVRALDARVLLAEGQALSVDRQAIAAIPEDRKQVLRNVPLTAIRSVDLEVERMVSPFSTATCVVVDRFGRTVPIPRPEVELFAGTVAGQPESRVFLSFAGEAAQGFVEFAGEKFVLASGSPEDPHPPAFFDTKSAAWQEIEWRPWSCNAISVPGFDEEVPVDGDASLMPTCRVIQLALDTDTQYLGRFNGNTTNAANYAAILVAATNWIYQAQASAIFQVTYLRLWSTPDPWTATDSLAALCQFQDYWNANMGSVGRDTAHLLLGTSVGGGIAYVGGICASGYSPDCGSSGSVSYGLSGGLNGSFPTPVASNSFGNWDLFVFAHELGHICGASHTFALSPPYDNCPSNCSNASTIGTIMSYCHQCPGGSSNIALTFAPPNVSQINSYIWSRPCVHTQECQSDPNCVLAATPATSLVPVAGQTVSVTVSGLHGSCSFAPTGLPSWITLGPGATAGTSGTLNFIVAANPGTADRTATIAIGARTHALTQMGSDRDGDGVPNESDNCVLVANPGQHDGDGDGFGNECDNCPLLANASQADANADGVGDACATPTGYSQTVNLGSVTVGGGCSPALTSPLAAAPGARIVAFTLQFGFTGNGSFSYASDVALGILGKQWGGYDCFLSGHEWVRSWTTIPASGQSGTYAETVTGLNLSMASAGAIQFANGWGNSAPVAYTFVTVTLQIQGAEPDSDGDGLPDQLDNCPGVASLDRSDFDGDGRGDACDECPTDPAKIEPGSCGCGQPDSDGDGDGIPDCEDNFCDAPSWLAGPFGSGGPSGAVLALARIGDDLYAGGAFQSIGAVNAQGLARLRTVSGVPAWSPLGATGINSQTAYLNSNGTVRALLATGGVLYAGGDFYTVDDNSSCRGVARWDPAAAGGSGQWSSLGSGVWKSNGSPAMVHAIAELGGRIYVAGSFNRAGTLTVNNIACWDPAANGGAGAWSALAAGITSAGNATQEVKALAAFGGRLYVGGQFATAGTLGVSSLACWDPAANAGAGAWSAVGAGLSGSTVIVNALAPYGTRLAIGGSFTGAGGAGASNLAAWDPTAGTWLSMTVLRTNNTVQDLAVQGDALLVGGSFTTAGPLTVNGVGSYRVSTNAWTALEQGFTNSTGPNVYALLPVVAGANLGVYAGGSFSRTATSYPANLAYWQSDTNRWTPVAAGGGEDSGLATVDGLLYGCLGHAGRLFVCGYLTEAGGLAANGIVAWNPAGNGGLGAWESLGGGLTGGSPLNGGLEMVELGGDLYVTGSFTHAGGQPAANIARWDPSANLGAGAWKALGSGLNGGGSALAVHGGVLYVGGSFTSAGGVSVSNIARWDPAANSGQGAWSAVGSGVNGAVNALAVHGGRIYAAGGFTTAGGAAASRIACWTPGTGTSGSWSSLGNGCDGTVDALASLGDSLYVGGYFGQAGSMSATRLARWTPAASGTGGTWSTVSENGEQGISGSGVEVRALRAFDGRLHIGGRFTSAGGVYSKDVVMWDDLNRFTAMGGGTHHGDLFKVRDFTEFQGRIYAVGDFPGMRNSSDAGQRAITSRGIASWGCPDQPTARPWTPGELAGVQAWFSPDTIRFDQGSGQFVPSWPSSVGSVTVASPNPSEWPRTSIGASGRKALWFDGINDSLAAGPTDLLRNVTGASAFTVRSFSDIPVSIQSFLHLSNGTSLSSPRLILRASATGRPESGVRRTDSAVTAIARSSSGVSEDFQIQGVVADFGQGSVRQFVNGAAAGQASISTGSSSNTPSLGLALGRTVNGTQRFAGSLAEAIIVGRALTVDERTRVEGYLAHRYDLADALPASHAYRHEAPTVEGDCSFTLAATSQTIPWTVGSSSLTVIANAYTCGWTVATDADWITLGLVGSVGSGSRTVAFTVSANLGDAPRVGTISIAGLVHTVTQEPACLGSFASSGSHVAATDGEGSVWFSTSGTSCAWTVSSDAPWLTLVDAPSTPTGTAEVRFAFAANGTGAARSALLTATVGGVPVEHHVTQAAPCAGTFGFESSVGHPGVAGYPNARIDVLEEVGGDLYAAGEFSSIGGVSASGIARRDGTTGQWLPLGSGLRGGGNFPPFSMQNIVAIGNRVYALGGFQKAGDLAGPLPGLAAWDTQLETWTTVGTDPPLGNFGSMVAHAGCLYVQGTVGANQPALGRFHPGRSQWSLVEGLPPASFLGSIASVRGRLHVAGWFPVQVDGVPTSRVRILSQDPQTGAWSVVFDASEEEASIESLFEFGGELHATGTFHYDGGLDPEPVVRFPTGAAGWLPLGGGAPWAGSARHGRSWNGKLCVTGRELDLWGNEESSLLAVFDPANGTWQRTTLAYRTEAIPWLDDPAFAPVGERLWIGGVLPAVRGVPVNGLATFGCGPDEYGPCVFGPDFPWSVDLEPGQYNSGDIAVDMANPWCDWYVQAYEPDGDPWNPWLSVEGGGPGDGSIHWSTPFVGCAENREAAILVSIRRPFDPWGDLERSIDASAYEVWCQSLAFTTKSTTVGSEGGEGQATLAMSCDDCDWSVTSDSDWIEIVEGEGYGDDSADGSSVERIILFAVAANEGVERTATLTSFDGRTLVVTQESGLVPWTPAVLSGVGAWFRADAIPEADRADGLVSRWIDSAGGFDLTATGSARPQFIASGLSGRPTVRFDGTDDALTRGSTALLNGKPGATMYTVRSFAAVPTAVRTVAFLSTGSAGNAARLAVRGGASGKPETAARRADGGTTVVATGTDQAATTAQLHGAVADFAGNLVTQFVDGSPAGTATPTAGSTSATNAASFALGRAGTGSNFHAGEIAEAIVVERALSTADRQRLEGYLAHRWGLAANLPESHPYRNAPPVYVVPCTVASLAYDAANEGPAAGTGEVWVSTDTSACGWTATSSQPWLSIDAPVGGQGVGSGWLGYSFAANATGSVRTATISIAVEGRVSTLTVTQQPSCPSGLGWEVGFANPGLRGPAGDVGFVHALQSLGGSLYAAGSFTQAGGQPAASVARWNPGTSSWSPLGSGLNGAASSFATIGGQLHVGGSFTTAGGAAANGVARWDPATSTWSALGAGLTGPSASVLALAEVDGQLYAGGRFVQSGSTLVSNVARWDPSSNSWLPLGTVGAGVDGVVHHAVGCRGKLYVSGEFNNVNGVEAQGIACWDPATGQWSTLPGLGEGWSWTALASIRGTIYAGARLVGLDEYWSQADSRVLRWDPTAGAWVSMGYLGAREPQAIAEFGGELLVAGLEFLGPGYELPSLHRRDPATGTWSDNAMAEFNQPAWKQLQIYQWASSLAVLDGGLFVGGSFTGVLGVHAGSIARLRCGPDEYQQCLSLGLSSTSVSVPNGGSQSGSVTVDLANPWCRWEVDSDENDWIGMTESGTGDGTIDWVTDFDGCAGANSHSVIVYLFDPYGGVVQWEWMDFSQASVPCESSSFVSTGSPLPAAGGEGSASLVMSCERCDWSVTSDSAWLTVTDGEGFGFGNGSGAVRTILFTAAPNAGPARTATLTAQDGRTLAIFQSAGATEWTPAALAGTQAWFKADAIPEADRVGNLVSRWLDSSASGLFPVTASSTRRPLFVANSLAGKPVVRFDGVNDGLNRGSSALVKNADGGMIIAVRRHSAVPTSIRTVAFLATGSSTANPRLTLRSSTTGRPQSVARRLDANANVSVNGPTAVPTAFQLHAIDANFVAGGLTQWVNGVAAGTAAMTAGLTSNTNALGLGIGRAAAASGYFAGDLAEVIIVSGAVSTADRQRLEGYLAHRWGLAASLPANHPHRDAPPTTGGPSCTYTLAQASASVPAIAGSGTVSLTASAPACAWTATSGASWLSVSPASGTGGGTLTFSHQANPDVAVRTGTITVAGQTFTVTQAETACSYALSATSASVPATAGSGTFTVTANGASCAWTATSGASWLSVSPESGAGGGTVTFSHLANPSGVARTGTITVGGQAFAVNQQAHPAPANDECANAIAIGPGVTPFDNRGAVTGTDNGPGCLEDGSTVNRYDVWFRYTATGSGEVTISTCGQTTIDTRISIFAACGDAAPIACNDQFCGNQSQVFWTATVGTTYWISLGSWSIFEFGTGTLTLTTSFAGTPNDECANAIAIGPGVTPFDTSGAQTGTDNGPTCLEFGSTVNFNDVWFAYTASADGEVTISTCGQSTLDTKLSVFANCGDGTPIACNDDDGTCDYQSSVAFLGTAGTRYLISLGSYGPSQFGTGTLTLTAPSPPWTPEALATLEAWYKADAIPEADRAGNVVTRWIDSKSSFDVTATGTAAPQFVAAAQAGRPVVRFDGVNDGLGRGTASIGVSATGGTMYAVRKFAAVPTSLRSVAWVSTGTASTTARMALRGNATGKPETILRRLDADAGITAAGATGVSTTAFEVHGTVVDWSGGAASQFVNGTAAGTATLIAGATSGTSSASVGIGRSGSATGFFQGDIAEVVIVKQALSTCERQKLEGYLAHRWGLAASLPATHPFRNAPPTQADSCGSSLVGDEPAGEGVATIEVPAETLSLQPWVDAAPDGATLRVPAGTYAGGLSVAGKALVIASDAGAAVTVLDGGGQVGTVLSVTGGASLTLRGFTVRGGLGGTPVAGGDGLVRLAGGGVLVREASASLVECIVEGNLAGFGGGVAAVDASFEAVASEIRGNHAAHDGGGLWSSGSVASLLGGAIRGNVAGAAGGGVHADAASALEAHATSICDNQPDEAQGEVGGEPGACSACAADLDGDGAVGSGDLAVLFAAWGTVDLPFDLDGDGAVSGGDVSVVFAAWGTACGE